MIGTPFTRWQSQRLHTRHSIASRGSSAFGTRGPVFPIVPQQLLVSGSLARSSVRSASQVQRTIPGRRARTVDIPCAEAVEPFSDVRRNRHRRPPHLRSQTKPLVGREIPGALINRHHDLLAQLPNLKITKVPDLVTHRRTHPEQRCLQQVVPISAMCSLPTLHSSRFTLHSSRISAPRARPSRCRTSYKCAVPHCRRIPRTRV